MSRIAAYIDQRRVGFQRSPYSFPLFFGSFPTIFPSFPRCFPPSPPLASSLEFYSLPSSLQLLPQGFCLSPLSFPFFSNNFTFIQRAFSFLPRGFYLIPLYFDSYLNLNFFILIFIYFQTQIFVSTYLIELFSQGIEPLSIDLLLLSFALACQALALASLIQSGIQVHME